MINIPTGRSLLGYFFAVFEGFAVKGFVIFLAEFSKMVKSSSQII